MNAGYVRSYSVSFCGSEQRLALLSSKATTAFVSPCREKNQRASRGRSWVGSVDRDIRAPRAMRCPAWWPRRGGFGQPVAGESRIARGRTHFFQQHRVRARVALTRVMRVRDRVLIVGVLDQTLNQRLHLSGVHFARDANTQVMRAATRAYLESKALGGWGSSQIARRLSGRAWDFRQPRRARRWRRALRRRLGGFVKMPLLDRGVGRRPCGADRRVDASRTLVLSRKKYRSQRQTLRFRA